MRSNNLSRTTTNDEFSEKDFYNKMDSANKALEERRYEDSWNEFFELYSLKKSKVISKELCGEAAYGLCRVMKAIPINHQFIKQFIETDKELVKKSKTRAVSNDYARKYIGRKYLVYAADDCNYYPAIEEYALNCVGKGPKNSFVFEYNDQDAEVGLHWALKLLNSPDLNHQTVGYMVRAIYYFGRYRKTKSYLDADAFCDNVIEAKKLTEDTNEYQVYYYGHVCADPNFKNYKDGKYYNPKVGYEYFLRAREIVADPDLVESANKIIVMLETKYPTMIEK